MKDTSRKGRVAELRVMARFLEVGYDNILSSESVLPYDFLAELDGEYKRIQVKLGTLNEDKSVIRFRTGRNKRHALNVLHRSNLSHIQKKRLICLQYIIQTMVMCMF